MVVIVWNIFRRTKFPSTGTLEINQMISTLGWGTVILHSLVRMGTKVRISFKIKPPLIDSWTWLSSTFEHSRKKILYQIFIFHNFRWHRTFSYKGVNNRKSSRRWRIWFVLCSKRLRPRSIKYNKRMANFSKYILFFFF